MCSKFISSLSEHMKTVHPSVGVKCGVCKKLFANLETFQLHMPEHEAGAAAEEAEGAFVQEEYPCDRWVCDKICATEAERITHLVRQHVCDLHKPVMKCYACSEIFLLKYSRELHFQEYPDHFIDEQGNTLPLPLPRPQSLLQCQLCLESYRLPGCLQEHLAWHADQRGLLCELCGYALGSLELLQQHLQSAHKFKKETQKPACDECSSGRCVHTVAAAAGLVCDFCGEVFSSKQFMDFHIRWHFGLPNDSRHYECDICDQVLVSAANLASHRELHFRDKRISCNVCGYVTNNVTYAKKHKALHKGDKDTVHWCKACNRSYGSETSLKMHVRTAHTHRGRRVAKQFECSVCQRKMPSRSALRIHMCSHTGKYPHRCKVCRGGFAIKVQLRNHLWKEHHIGSFQCTMCNESFGHIKTRTEHYKIAHRGFKTPEEEAEHLLKLRVGRKYTKAKKD
ncbi:Hypothetical predicted protein [Cloeon dipterum]|uniref:C2H2-type domain-containing protein n=1 Tax=Cloeon dipterum TaxID=197152 RepID=A0A8S1E225_9INSE|nr:Hypothetical predicted protein [Cloeon dipterum]